MHVFSHVGVPGNEGADALAPASLNQHPLLALKTAQPAQALTPTQPFYNMPRMVQMHFAPPVPLLEAVQAPHRVDSPTRQPQPPPQPQSPASQPGRLSAAALADLQRELLETQAGQQEAAGDSEGSSDDLDGPRQEGNSRKGREVVQLSRDRDSGTGEGRGEGSRVAESVWGALGLEQMSSKGLGTVGSSIDSGNTRQGPGPPQDADLAGESSTDSAGCSGTEASQTVYSRDVSEGVARKGRARCGYKTLKPY